MSNLEKVKEFLIQAWDYIKNKKIAIFIGILVIIGTQIFQNITNEGTNSVMNSFKDIEIEDCIITPISYEDSQSISRTLQEAREYSEDYGKDILQKGFTTNIFLRNNKSKPMSISESSIVIDDIKKAEDPQVYLFGIYDDINNLFSLYLVNNNLGDFDEGVVEITADYQDISSTNINYFSEEEINQIFNTGDENQIPFTFENLRGGEIRKISSYKFELDIMDSLWAINLNYKITNDGDVIQDGYLGSFLNYNDSISFQMRAGGESDYIIEKSTIIDVEEDQGKIINIPTNFLIDEESMKSLSYTVYPTSSCIMKFHIDIKDTNNNHIKSNIYNQEVYVPLYEEDYLLWDRLKYFVKKYEIDTYYYNSNPTIQKEIGYSPSNKDTDYSSPDSETESYDPENY